MDVPVVCGNGGDGEVRVVAALAPRRPRSGWPRWLELLQREERRRRGDLGPTPAPEIGRPELPLRRHDGRPRGSGRGGELGQNPGLRIRGGQVRSEKGSHMRSENNRGRKGVCL